MHSQNFMLSQALVAFITAFGAFGAPVTPIRFKTRSPKEDSSFIPLYLLEHIEQVKFFCRCLAASSKSASPTAVKVCLDLGTQPAREQDVDACSELADVEELIIIEAEALRKRNKVLENQSLSLQFAHSSDSEYETQDVDPSHDKHRQRQQPRETFFTNRRFYDIECKDKPLDEKSPDPHKCQGRKSELHGIFKTLFGAPSDGDTPLAEDSGRTADIVESEYYDTPPEKPMAAPRVVEARRVRGRGFGSLDYRPKMRQMLEKKRHSKRSPDVKINGLWYKSDCESEVRKSKKGSPHRCLGRKERFHTYQLNSEVGNGVVILRPDQPSTGQQRRNTQSRERTLPAGNFGGEESDSPDESLFKSYLDENRRQFKRSPDVKINGLWYNSDCRSEIEKGRKGKPHRCVGRKFQFHSSSSYSGNAVLKRVARRAKVHTEKAPRAQSHLPDGGLIESLAAGRIISKRSPGIKVNGLWFPSDCKSEAHRNTKNNPHKCVGRSNENHPPAFAFNSYSDIPQSVIEGLSSERRLRTKERLSAQQGRKASKLDDRRKEIDSIITRNIKPIQRMKKWIATTSVAGDESDSPEESLIKGYLRERAISKRSPVVKVKGLWYNTSCESEAQRGEFPDRHKCVGRKFEKHTPGSFFNAFSSNQAASSTVSFTEDRRARPRTGSVSYHEQSSPTTLDLRQSFGGVVDHHVTSTAKHKSLSKRSADAKVNGLWYKSNCKSEAQKNESKITHGCSAGVNEKHFSFRKHTPKQPPSASGNFPESQGPTRRRSAKSPKVSPSLEYHIRKGSGGAINHHVRSIGRVKRWIANTSFEAAEDPESLPSDILNESFIESVLMKRLAQHEPKPRREAANGHDPEQSTVNLLQTVSRLSHHLMGDHISHRAIDLKSRENRKRHKELSKYGLRLPDEAHLGDDLRSYRNGRQRSNTSKISMLSLTHGKEGSSSALNHYIQSIGKVKRWIMSTHLVATDGSNSPNEGLVQGFLDVKAADRLKDVKMSHLSSREVGDKASSNFINEPSHSLGNVVTEDRTPGGSVSEDSGSARSFSLPTHSLPTFGHGPLAQQERTHNVDTTNNLGRSHHELIDSMGNFGANILSGPPSEATVGNADKDLPIGEQKGSDQEGHSIDDNKNGERERVDSLKQTDTQQVDDEFGSQPQRRALARGLSEKMRHRAQRHAIISVSTDDEVAAVVGKLPAG